MENEFSQVHIQTPTVPADFEAKVGNTKTAFAEALLDLVAKSIIKGINLDLPENFDLAEIQNRINAIDNTLNLTTRKQRVIGMDAVSNGAITVPFEDIGTTNYTVNVVFITTNADINTVTWSLIAGSKTTSQCQIRIDGAAADYDIEVQIMEIKS